MGEGNSTSEAPVAADAPRAPDTASGRADKAALVFGIVVAAVVLVGVVLCLAAVKRGLDITDESDYIVSELHAGAYLRSSTEFQLLLGPVLSLVKYIWLLRVVKIVGLVAVHVFFAWCFLKAAPGLMGARFKRFDAIAVGAAIIAGALALSVYGPQTPGYNEVSVSLLLTAAGVLLLLADHRIPPRFELAIWAVLGFLVWFQLVVRWPSLTAIVPLAAFTLFWTARRPAQLLKCAAAALVGAVVGAVGTQLFLAPVSAIVRGIRQGNADASAALGHDRGHLLHQYVTNLSYLARTMTHSFWYLLAAAIATGVLLGFRRWARPIAFAAAAGLVAITPILIHSHRARGGVDPQGGPSLSLVLARAQVLPLYVTLAIVVAVAAFVIKPESRPTLRTLAFIAALLVAPFLSALGTNNPLQFNAVFIPAFWIAGALGLTSLVHREYARPLVHGLAFAFAALLAFTSFYGTWRNPYRQTPLADDTVNVSLSGPLHGLRVDGATAVFLEQMRTAADSVTGAVPPTMIVWSPGLPGASLAAGLHQPIYAWLSAQLLAELSLTSACQDSAHGILLVLPSPVQLNEVTGDPNVSACFNRTWSPRPSVDTLAVYYAGPTS